MLENYIGEAIKLNRIQLDSFKGIQVFYKKSIHWFSLAGWVALIILLLVALKKNSNSFVFFCLPLVYVLYNLTETIGRLLIKKPVFIIEENNIYYLKTNTWYNIANYQFQERSTGRINLFLTYCMIDRKGKAIFSEKNWWLEDTEKLKDQIRWIQLPEEKKKEIRHRRDR